MVKKSRSRTLTNPIPMSMSGQVYLDNLRSFRVTLAVEDNRLFLHSKKCSSASEMLLIRPLRAELLSEHLHNTFCAYAFQHGVRRVDFMPQFSSLQVFSPKQRRYFLLEITAEKKPMRKMFFEFCEATKREYCVLGPDFAVSLGRDEFSFLEATLVNQRKLDSLKKMSSRHKSVLNGHHVIESANAMVRERNEASEIVERWSFLDQLEAKSPPFRDKVYACAKRRAAAIEKLISTEFGVPTETGTSDCDSIPVQDVFRYAIWKKGKRQLYLCCSHFDQMTDVSIVLGTKKVR